MCLGKQENILVDSRNRDECCFAVFMAGCLMSIFVLLNICVQVHTHTCIYEQIIHIRFIFTQMVFFFCGKARSINHQLKSPFVEMKANHPSSMRTVRRSCGLNCVHTTRQASAERRIQIKGNVVNTPLIWPPKAIYGKWWAP